MNRSAIDRPSTYVGAKHLGDHLCNSAKILISKCFALPHRSPTGTNIYAKQSKYFDRSLLQFNENACIQILRRGFKQDCTYSLSVGEGEAVGYKYLGWVSSIVARLLRPYRISNKEE
ncbi:hypothetical protein [Microcoleus sp. herbarium12]|uniref:hypothetical protein n=1 Tax=Microcoleus sp. herbarium12 TaxID=3055437 RepID=UPI002FD5799D